MIIFDPKSAYKHFKEDRLDEDGIRKAMAHPEWIALIDPADPAIPPERPATWWLSSYAYAIPARWTTT